MNPAGIILIIAGAWITAQVFGGNALERMNILKPKQDSGSGSGTGTAAIAPGVNSVLPGSPSNPAYVDLRKFFGAVTDGAGRAL